MAATIGKVRAVFTASTSGLTAGVNTAAASMRRMENAVSSLRGPLNSLVAINAAQLFGSIASAAANYARSLAALVVSTSETVSSQNDLANRLGLTYGELAGLSFAGSMVGVSMDQIGAAMTRAQVAFSNAANGSRTAQAAFQAIGLSVADLNGMTAEQQFEAIAQAISQLPSEAERAAAAVRIFGRAGAELLPLFNQGAAGIQAARDEAERLGLTLTNAQAGNIDDMGDSFDRARAAVTGVIQQVEAYLSPAIKGVFDTFTNLIGSIGGANIGQTIGNGILQAARYFAQVVDYFIVEGSKIWQYASQIGAQWNAVWEFGQRVAAFFSGVFNIGKVVLGSIINLFSSAVQGLAQIAQKIGSFLGFDTSSLDTFIEGAKGFNESLRQGVEDAAKQAEQDFGVAFGQTQQLNKAGEAIAGPATKLIDDAIVKAESAAKAVDEAKPQRVEIKEKVEVALDPVNEAVKGIDSRSREGVAEMFRIMRGNGDNAQERIADATEEIAVNTRPRDELDEGVVAMALA